MLSAFERPPASRAGGCRPWHHRNVFRRRGHDLSQHNHGEPDKIKASRQIDVNDSTGDIVLKLDPRDGKEIWKHSMGGKIAYLRQIHLHAQLYAAAR